MRHGVQSGFLCGLLLVFGITLVAAGGPSTETAEPANVPRKAHVFVHPEPLKPGDELTDGERGKPIKISSPTTLVWIDRMPDARYQHPTEYVLISAEETRIIKGGWWPVLNGKSLFRDGTPKTLTFPVKLSTPQIEGAP